MAGGWERSTGQARTSTHSWRQLRLRILERDHGTCWLCGKGGADQVDHVTPVSKGGTDDEQNLWAAHRACHLRKTSAEGNAARRKYSTRRPAERHPGLLP